MRPKTLAVAAGVLLVAGLAATAAALHFLDPASYAASLAASVKADTGRELSLGAVKVRLLPRPALVLTDLRFGNAAWGSQPWLAQAGRASADIDVLALFSRQLRITRIEVSDASLFLETDRKGRGNWEIDRVERPDAAAAAPAQIESLQIDGLALKSVAIAFKDGIGGKTTEARIDTARIDADSAQGELGLSARVTYSGNEVNVSGTLGSLAALIADAPGFPVNLELRTGTAQASLRGTIDKPRRLEGIKLALSVQAPQFAELAAMFGASVPPSWPMRATAQLTGAAAAPALSGIDAVLGGAALPEIRLRGSIANLRQASGVDLQLISSAGRWWRFGTARSAPRLPPFRARVRLRDAQQGYQLDDLELRIAESAVNATLQLVRSGPRLRITGKVAAPLIELAHLVPETGAATASGAAPGAPRAADHWKLADLDIDLSVGRLVLPGGRELRSGSGRVALESGRLHVEALQASLGGGKVTITGSAADPQHLAGLDLGITLQGGELAELLGFFGVSIEVVGPYQGRAQVQGSIDAPKLTAIEAQVGRSAQRVQVSGEVGNVLTGQGMQLETNVRVGDSVAAGRLFGAEVPRLPALRGTARVVEAPGGYALENLKLAMGRSSVEGRFAFARGEQRPRLTADLSGTLVDLSELTRSEPKPGGGNPLLLADIDANLRLDKMVLPNRRALGPVSGGLRLAAGALELKQMSIALEGVTATLDGRLSEVPDGYALAGVKISHAVATMTGDVAVTRGADRWKINARGSSPLLDVAALMEPAGKESARKPPAAGARLIPDLPLPLDSLRVFDSEIDLRFDAVRFGEAGPLGPLQVRATLADGRLKADPVLLGAAEGQMLVMSGSIDATHNEWMMRAEGKGVDFGTYLTRLGHAGVVSGGSTDLSIRLQGRGKSLGAVLGSLSGEARIAMGPHRIHNFAIGVQGGVIASVFAMANPFQKTDPDTDVKCFAASVPIGNGILKSERRIALETAKYNVVASGTMNLRTERIDFALTPIVRSEARTSVRLGGTLAAPKVGLDVAGAAKSAASIGVAVVAPVWYIADSLIKKAVSDPNPCATALAVAPR